MKDSDYFSIGEVSKLKNVTVKALRYYHDIGLLIPAYIDPNTKYRYYSIQQFIYLDIIKLCKKTNVSIEETKALFATIDTPRLQSYLDQKSKSMTEEMKKLEMLKSRIDLLKDTICLAERERKKEGFNIQSFDERFLISLPTYDGELNEMKAFDELDEKLNDSANQTFQYGLIYLNQNENRNSSKVFRLITAEDYQQFKNKFDVILLPKGTYLTINSTKNTEDEMYRMLREYLYAHRLTGSCIYLFYLVTDVFNSNNHYSQFQVRLT